MPPGRGTAGHDRPASRPALAHRRRTLLPHGATRVHTGQEGLLLRILKLSEEVGEVAEAVIGATGQNPRKGFSHTWDDVQAELCDVAITALMALRTLTPDRPRGVRTASGGRAGPAQKPSA